MFSGMRDYFRTETVSILFSISIGLLIAYSLVKFVQYSIIDIYRITNESLTPNLYPGDRVWILKTDPCIRIPFFSAIHCKKTCRPNEIFVFQHPAFKTPLIKFAVEAKDNTGKCFFIGSNLENSVDSRNFGSIHLHDVLGRVVWTHKFVKLPHDYK